MAKVSKLQIAAAGAALLVLAAGAAGLATFVLRDTASEETAEAHDDDLQIAGAKIAVTNRMADAQSIAFGKIFVHWDGEVPSVCGRVDIQEAQDEFDGEERFVFSESTLTLEEADGSDAVSQKWSDVCE